MFPNAVRKIESFHALAKFLTPTNSPAFPTLVLDSDSQTPMMKGYAMNVPRITTAGAKRRAASARSFSRSRVSLCGWVVRGWGSTTSRPAALPAPPAIGLFTPYP